MGKSIEVDLDRIYKAWRVYLIGKTEARYFGMIFDVTRQAKFPYANFRMLGRSTNGSDLQGDESSIQLTFETEGYINDNKYLTLYDIDTASTDFFFELGFKKIGDSPLIKVSDTVTKISSRFLLQNYCGYFLKEIGSF